MAKLLERLLFRLRGIKVYALVGKSGTGKSFRAQLLMEKYGIDLMIDDGLLIKDRRIVAGRSAKREKNYLSAVKTALFNDRQHRNEVLRALESMNFKRVLILGTSERMVIKIAQVLRLPPIQKMVKIEDIATAEEINTAIHYRNTQGRHVIPVPTIEVKRTYPRIMADSLKVLFKRGLGIGQKRKLFEKTVVRPEFSRKGEVSISKAALSQMILHCVDEYGQGIRIKRLLISKDREGYHIDLFLDIPLGVQLSGTVHELQNYIVDEIERYTGIIIDELNVTIESLDAAAAPERKRV
jgi:adenylate kinase family enzyme